MPAKRYGKRWTIVELLSLQREYELLELSIKEIAIKHQRNQAGILSKLQAEGFIESWDKARGFDILEYQKMNNEDEHLYACEDEDEDEEEEEEEPGDEDEEYAYEDDDESEDEHEDSIASISDRVWNLENRLNEIATMVSKIFDKMITSNQITQSCQN